MILKDFEEWATLYPSIPHGENPFVGGITQESYEEWCKYVNTYSFNKTLKDFEVLAVANSFDLTKTVATHIENPFADGVTWKAYEAWRASANIYLPYIQESK